MITDLSVVLRILGALAVILLLGVAVLLLLAYLVDH
jgi:hypothetical protein